MRPERGTRGERGLCARARALRHSDWRGSCAESSAGDGGQHLENEMPVPQTTRNAAGIRVCRERPGSLSRGLDVSGNAEISDFALGGLPG